jgi:hypothetical protein
MSKVTAYQNGAIIRCSQVNFLALLKNIRLGCKCLTGTNSLAYLPEALVTKEQVLKHCQQASVSASLDPL